MAKVQEVIVKARFKMPLWDCIKLRICGLYNTVSSIDTMGDLQTIQFNKKYYTVNIGLEYEDKASEKLEEATDLLIENKYKCAPKIWKKFSATERQRYNELMELLNWDMLYHADVNSHKNKSDIIDVTAHNIACQLVWNNK